MSEPRRILATGRYVATPEWVEVSAESAESDAGWWRLHLKVAGGSAVSLDFLAAAALEAALIDLLNEQERKEDP